MKFEDSRDQRYIYHCQVIVATHDKSCIAELENLSRAGCCIKRPLDWDFSLNDVLNLYFIIDNDNVIDVEAMLVWEDKNHVGLQYLQAQAVPIQIIDEVE